MICFLIFLSLLLVSALPFLDGGETWLACGDRAPCRYLLFSLLSLSARHEVSPCFETCGCGIFALQDRNGVVETERRLCIYPQRSTSVNMYLACALI